MSENNELMYPQVVVVCRNDLGSPDIYAVEPEVTCEQYEKGLHYKMAMENAEINGFQGPMAAFDGTDPAARKLLGITEWLRVKPCQSGDDADDRTPAP